MTLCKEVSINGKTYLKTDEDDYLFSITEKFNYVGKYDKENNLIKNEFYKISDSNKTHLDEKNDNSILNIGIKAETNDEKTNESVIPKQFVCIFVDSTKLHYHTILFWKYLESKGMFVILIGEKIPCIRVKNTFFQNILTCNVLLEKLKNKILVMYAETSDIFKYLHSDSFPNVGKVLVIHKTSIISDIVNLNKNFIDYYTKFMFYSEDEKNRFQRIYNQIDKNKITMSKYLVKGIKTIEDDTTSKIKTLITYDSDPFCYINIFKELDPEKYKLIIFNDNQYEDMPKNIEIFPRCIENFICLLKVSNVFITLEHCYYTHFNITLAKIGKLKCLLHDYYTNMKDDNSIILLKNENNNDIKKFILDAF